MDRIDIVMDVARPSPEALVAGRAGASSKELRAEVDEGRAFRAWRRGRSDDVVERATDPSSFGLTREALDLLVQISHATVLSARRIAGLCRVARTIADMDRSEDVETGHLLEASAFQGVR